MARSHALPGIVYEGVIENPERGESATLYYTADASGSAVTSKQRELDLHRLPLLL